MLLEELQGMVAETGVQVLQATRFGRVGAEFEDAFAVGLRLGQEGIIRSRQEGGFHLGDQLAVDLGSLLGGLPVGIGAESFPGGVAGGAIGISQEVDQLVLRVVRRDEIAEVGHAMFREKLERVIAEAGVEGVEFAFGGEVHAHLEETGVGGGRRGGGRGQEAEGEEGEQGFHVI